MKSKTLLFFYFIILIVEIVAEVLFLKNGNANLVYFTKPLLMPTLIVWAFLFAKENNSILNKTLVIALVFSLSGDISLMLLSINPDIFIVGLASFLITHIIYTVLFIKIPSHKKSLLKAKPYLILPFIIYSGLLVWYLYQQNHAEFIQMQIPVLVYATVILVMLLAAISCFGKISNRSYTYLTIGAFLFVLSDTTIALSKFTPLFQNHQHIARIIIMSLYGTAQFLIIKGYLNPHNSKNRYTSDVPS